MLDSQWLQILCCPESRQSVVLATAEKLARVNQLVSQGTIKNQSGQVVQEEVEALLIRQDGRLGYPIRQGIPIMLQSEAWILEVS